MNGRAVFALVPSTYSANEVACVALTEEGEINKCAIALGLADLLVHSLEAISESDMEREYLLMHSLDRLERLFGGQEKKTAKDFPDELIEILRKAVEG